MSLKAAPIVFLCLAGFHATAGTGRTSQASCDAAVYRQFDFWIGEWDVHTERNRAKGTPALSRIREVSSGCAVVEEYRNPWGQTATSLSSFDDTSRQWRQVLVDDRGRATLLSGHFDRGRMVLYDQASNGTRRVTWEPLPDGSVRQYGEILSDGTNWRTSFDALYSPR